MAGTRPLLLLPLALIVAAVAVACGGGGDDERTPGDPVTVSLWHSMVSPLDGALQTIVDGFNAAQDEYVVEPVFQGSYTDSLNKLINSVRGDESPSLVQLDDVSTQIMIDSGAITPVQDFIDDEVFDLSDFDPRALGYYTIDETLYSMPFNLSGPILYYDRQDFIDAGLDPDDPPRTLDEVREAAEQLVRRDDSGEVERHGIALQISPWIFEQMLAKQGALYANNENGRDGRVTDVAFDGPEGEEIIRWYQDMVEDGLALNVGTRNEDTLLSLAQDRASMAIESTAALSAAVALVAVLGDDPQRIGTGPMPAPEGDGGIVLGGASLWIMSETPDDEQLGAWEFIKFATTPEQQAQWHADTGYFLARVSAYDLPAAVERREQFPQFETAVEQLRASPDTPATRGALLGSFKGVRDRITDAFENVLLGGADPAEELQAAADDAEAIIKEYNRTAP